MFFFFLDSLLTTLRRSWRVAVRITVEQVLAEGPLLKTARRAILAQLANPEESYFREAEDLKPVAYGLSEEDVRRYLTFETERRKSIDEKAKANLVAITVGFTVLVASLNFIGRSELKASLTGKWGIVSFLLLALGVIYLLYGGLKALDALQIARIYTPSPVDESGVCESTRKVNLLWCLQQNQRTALLRTNAVSVSYRSIRNGVVTLGILILLIAGRILLFLPTS